MDPYVEEQMDVAEESSFHGFSLSVDVRGVVVDVYMAGERVVGLLWSDMVLFGRVGVLNSRFCRRIGWPCSLLLRFDVSIVMVTGKGHEKEIKVMIRTVQGYCVVPSCSRTAVQSVCGRDCVCIALGPSDGSW